jgi:hypothetical protein
MLTVGHGETDLSQNSVLRFMKQRFRVSEQLHGDLSLRQRNHIGDLDHHWS